MFTNLFLVLYDLMALFASDMPLRRKVGLFSEALRISFNFFILYRLLRRDIKSDTVLGRRFFFPNYHQFFIQFREIFLRSAYSYGNPGIDAIFDGGANIGMVSIYYRMKYPSAKIFSFEPDPVAFSFLKRNIQANRMGNIVLVNAALGGKKGFATFYSATRPAESVRSNLYGGDGRFFRKVTSRVAKLSEYIEGRRILVKLDIEGAEADVLLEMERSGKLKRISQFALEYHHNSVNKGASMGRFLQVLERNGFSYAIDAKLFKGVFAKREQGIMLYAEKNA